MMSPTIELAASESPPHDVDHVQSHAAELPPASESPASTASIAINVDESPSTITTITATTATAGSEAGEAPSTAPTTTRASVPLPTPLPALAPAPVTVLGAVPTGTDDDDVDPFHERARLVLVTATSVPQVLATAVLAPNLWAVDLSDSLCARELVWVLVQALYLTLSTVNYWGWHWLRNAQGVTRVLSSTQRERGLAGAKKLQAALYVFGLCWFMVGNVLLLVVNAEASCHADVASGGDDGVGSQHGARTDSDGEHASSLVGVSELATLLLVLAYARVFWPCTLFVLLLPFAVCCRPCLLRVMGANGLDPAMTAMQPPRGASRATINATTKRKPFRKNMALRSSFMTRKERGHGGVDEEGGSTVVEPNACCICLLEYERGDPLRILRCGHDYHEACVDQWLVRNASCPTCRKPLITQRTRSRREPTPALPAQPPIQVRTTMTTETATTTGGRDGQGAGTMALHDIDMVV